MRALIAALVLLAPACGGDDGPVTIADARDRSGVFLVEGYLVERDGELRLCEAILESFPPQCGEPSLRAVGPGLAPSEERVSLLGRVEDGTITVAG